MIIIIIIMSIISINSVVIISFIINAIIIGLYYK